MGMKTLIRNPLNIRLVVAWTAAAVMMGFISLMADYPFTRRFILTLCIIHVLMIVAVLIRRFLLKPRQMEIYDEALVIGNQTLHVRDISGIYVENERVIGIKPVNKKVVPVNLCFEFVNSSSEIQVFLDWAKRHDIKVSQETFMKWI